MTKDEALTLALEVLEDWDSPLALPAIIAIKEALAQPDYRAVKTYHEGKPVYVSQTEFPPECKTVAEQTAYAFGWWKALESVRTKQPAQEPIVGTKTWFEDGKIVTQNLRHSDVYTTPPAAPMQEPKFVRMVDGVPCITLAEHKHLMAAKEKNP